MKKIILISGKAMSGKDSCAEFLKQELEARGQKVVITHFAKYIKQILADYYQWDGIKTDYWRTKLQELGTDTIREKLKMPLFHCGRIVDDIKIIQNDFDYIIVPDARFKNEVLYAQASFPDDVITIRVERVGWKSSLTPEQQIHKSETDLDNFKFDYTIYAQSGLDHLHDETRRVLKDVLL